jgi:hypothetical protein
MSAEETLVLTSHRIFAIAALGFGTLAAACAADATSSPLAVKAHPSFAVGDVDPCNPDITAPVISAVSASPNTLWSPNHKMNNVTVSTVASDNCSGVPVCSVVSASSNEPENGLGDGNTAPDIIITGANTLQVRAERAGVGSGRVYTIGVTCTDVAGNVSLPAYTTVTVAHDQGKRS